MFSRIGFCIVMDGARSCPVAVIPRTPAKRRSTPQKNKSLVTRKINVAGDRKVRLMFQDEAGFGRINKPKYCWSQKGFRPCVLCHHIREYRYAYGAVEPLTGESFFLVMPYARVLTCYDFENNSARLLQFGEKRNIMNG